MQWSFPFLYSFFLELLSYLDLISHSLGHFRSVEPWFLSLSRTFLSWTSPFLGRTVNFLSLSWIFILLSGLWFLTIFVWRLLRSIKLDEYTREFTLKAKFEKLLWFHYETKQFNTKQYKTILLFNTIFSDANQNTWPSLCEWKVLLARKQDV